MGKSKAQKKSEKKIKKYYGEKESDVVQKAKTETERFQEDLRNIYKDIGVKQSRETEDYIRNIGNIQSNKAADVSDINYYVKTMSGRTREDLSTSLAKEARRYSLEGDKINQDLADTGLTFSERTPEKVAAETSRLATAGIKTEANRSFQDIARYEATKNRDLELKYGQQVAETGVETKRSLEDILNKQQDDALKNQRGVQDIAFGEAIDIRDISYGRDTDIATTGFLFNQQKALEKNNKMSGLT